jgi:hypothetical protein
MTVAVAPCDADQVADPGVVRCRVTDYVEVGDGAEAATAWTLLTPPAPSGIGTLTSKHSSIGAEPG